MKLLFVSTVPEKLGKKKQNARKHKKKVPVIIASDGLWSLQIELHNTCSLFSTSDFSFGDQKEKKNWKRAVLFKSALQFDALWIICFHGCWAKNAGCWEQWGECTLAGVCERLGASSTATRRAPAVSCPVTFFYCNCSVIFQPSCKFLKLFTATEVLQILYNSVNVL